ncbi:MAG: hypothetical protein HRT57_11410 [Crocinitomicaceae bacterium]|nr:hypothetical protein [Crocinitomicaceae bacterium]
MILFTLIIFLSSSLLSYSQNGNYIINVNYSASVFESQPATYSVFNFAPEIEYDNRFSFNLGIGYIRAKTQSYQVNNYKKTNGIQASFSASKRILKGQSKLSPLAGITVGSTIVHNHLGCYSSAGAEECLEDIFYPVPREANSYSSQK